MAVLILNGKEDLENHLSDECVVIDTVLYKEKRGFKLIEVVGDDSTIEEFDMQREIDNNFGFDITK